MSALKITPIKIEIATNATPAFVILLLLCMAVGLI
jgi:hypothetical protein